MLYVNLNIKLKLRKKKRYPPTGQHNTVISHKQQQQKIFKNEKQNSCK